MNEMHGKVGFSSRTRAGYVSLDSGNPNQDNFTQPTVERQNAVNPWAEWGTANNLPITMTKYLETCGVLSAAIDGKARFGMGRGPRPFKIKNTKADGTEELEPVINPEIEEWLEESDMIAQCFRLFRDFIGFGLFHSRFKFNNDGSKIGLFIVDDVTEMRYQREKNGMPRNTYLCADWSKQPTLDDKSLLMYPMVPTVGSATYLTGLEQKARRNKEYSFTGKIPSWNRHYYPMPLWWAAKEWVDIAKGVPAMKKALFENNIRVKYMVIVYDSYWERTYGTDWDTYTEEKRTELREALYDSIDSWLVGAENSYKSMYIPGAWNELQGKQFQDIEIKLIEDNVKDGELLPDSAAANSEILFSLMMNPALMGASMPGGSHLGGAGSGSDIREAALVQVMIHEFERSRISKVMNIVKRVNGWDSDIVWRFPGLVLTTLDTGGSTKSVTTGS